MKRLALFIALLAIHGAFLERSLLSGRRDGLDSLSPQSREIEEAIAESRFADALPIALELERTYPNESLPQYWLALLYRGLDRPRDEVTAWERFIERGAAGAEACPGLADAHARLGDRAGELAAYERCARLDPADAERLIDLGQAFERAAKRDAALETYRKAAALDPRHPLPARAIVRLAGEPVRP